MSTAIRVEGISKKYQLGLTHSGSVRELANRVMGRFAKHLKSERGSNEAQDGEKQSGSFWALKDITFDVSRGEVLGVIGHNGAGKSTLLKLLSRITLPTEGRAELRGRVASLLEVGTGFHPELTGRENVYLNGTILGMTRREIDSQLDAIIEFAGVARFIDTPVKRYSSGMKVRLGFAVAAHLRPEILIVDEVLAVGDVDFQAKCLGKMNDVANDGRTVLFVSHNMAAVRTLCRTGLVLNQGRTDGCMPISDAVALYMKTNQGAAADGLFTASPADESVSALTRIEVRQSGQPTALVRHDESIELHFSASQRPYHATRTLSIAVCDAHNRKVFTAAQVLPDDAETELVLSIRGRFLMPGRYSLIAGIIDASAGILDHHRFVCPFSVENAGDPELSRAGADAGIVFGEFTWK